MRIEESGDCAFLDNIMDQMQKRPSIAGHRNLKPFAVELSGYLERFAELRKQHAESVSQTYPRGWETRSKAASDSVQKLAWALTKMQPDELIHWMPPSETLRDWSGAKPSFEVIDGDSVEQFLQEPEDQYYMAVDRWVQVVEEMAYVVSLRASLPVPRREKRAEKIRFYVGLIARAWVRNFDMEPKSSENSVFYLAVTIFFVSMNEDVPAYQSVRGALKLLSGD